MERQERGTLARLYVGTILGEFHESFRADEGGEHARPAAAVLLGRRQRAGGDLRRILRGEARAHIFPPAALLLVGEAKPHRMAAWLPVGRALQAQQQRPGEGYEGGTAYPAKK